MNKKNLPKLLVITVNAWSDQNSTGNTISNHFGNWDPTKLSNIYLRDEEIDNDCCTTYFKICEKDIVNSFFSKKGMGSEINYLKQNKTNSNPKILKASKIKSFLIRIRPTIILLLREVFWKIGFRSKTNLNNFLKKNVPEIIHMHCPNLIYGHRMLYYCHKQTKAKVVLFFGDEIYTYKNFWPLSVIYQSILRYWIRKNIKISEINYAATPELSSYYSQLFGKEFKVLYKGAIILPPSPKLHSKPIKIVYAGNLLYDRWRALSLISKAIEKVSTSQTEFQLSIYTGTALSNEMNISLNTKYSSIIGAVPFSEIKKIIESADIVLHVESFKKKYVNIIKYSFSTKIVDCIQSGSCVMGFGPIELASINFLKQSKAAIVVNTYDDIYTRLQEIIQDNNIIDDYSTKMYNFSKNTFNLDIIRKNIYEDILELVSLNEQNK
ncbi:hypothetical protein [Flavobacterium sp.]|uniref:hypothetical protein n=1 Tax=Flavobacterium sp. TaxID=239 RepID=UPI0038FC0B99